MVIKLNFNVTCPRRGKFITFHEFSDTWMYTYGFFLPWVTMQRGRSGVFLMGVYASSLLEDRGWILEGFTEEFQDCYPLSLWPFSLWSPRELHLLYLTTPLLFLLNHNRCCREGEKKSFLLKMTKITWAIIKRDFLKCQKKSNLW